MKLSLEDISEGIDFSQKSGVFLIPELIKKRRVIRYFLEDSKKEKTHPLVVAEEKYTRQSAMYKLGFKRNYSSNRNLVLALLEYWLLRTPDNELPNYHGAPLDNLSLAQVISFAYQVPIEKVLVKKSYFSSKKFKSLDKNQRIKILVSAYRGTSWSERFERKYKRRKSRQKFTLWHNISLRELPQLLCTSDYEPGDTAGNLTKLVNAGLLIPKGKFKRFASRNFVDVSALVCLASEITGKTHLYHSHNDPYIDYIARKFISERLLPHARKTNLDLNKDITLETARHRTGLDSDVLSKVLRIKPDKSKRFYSRITKIPAIDLALYELKNTYIQVFDEHEIASLFGMKNIDLERCNIFPNSKGTYPRHQRVFPFYESVGEVVKKMLVKKTDGEKEPLPVSFNGSTYYLTQKAIRSYVSVYDIPEFNSLSMAHLVQCLNSGTRINGWVISKELIFRIIGDSISSVKINTQNYSGPVMEREN